MNASFGSSSSEQKFLEIDFFHEKLSRETPIYIVMEGSEPPFFTRFFSWDSAKSDVRIICLLCTIM